MPPPVGEPTAPPVCPRHPDRESWVSCQRCRRPVCPSCQRPAAVGVQCVDCVAEGAKSIPATRTVFGGRTVGTPRVTQALIAVCAAAYVLQLTQRSTTETFAFVPLLGWEQPWRALTAAFLHSPTMPLHLALNMFWLWQIGGYLESLLGRARFLALYLVCAIGGSAGVLMLAPAPRAILRSSAEAAQYAAWGTPVVGASGAVFGLFGALLVLNRHLGRSSAALYGVLAVNVVFGFVVPGIAWQAHLGGLVTGVIVAGVFAVLSTRERRTLQWPTLAVVLVVIVAAMVLQYQGVPDIYR
ncbi:MAG: rhomboid family intramembrane serine protease [Actinomycetales bacterium]|nr:rhomboid family intramembrane serine protease [Actinomycetales bacterium]